MTPALAVDAGQTEIRVALAGERDPRPAARAPGVQRMDGAAVGADHVADALIAAVDALGPLPAARRRWASACPGSRPPAKEDLRHVGELLRARLGVAQVTIASDGVTSLLGALGEQARRGGGGRHRHRLRRARTASAGPRWTAGDRCSVTTAAPSRSAARGPQLGTARTRRAGRLGGAARCCGASASASPRRSRRPSTARPSRPARSRASRATWRRLRRTATRRRARSSRTPAATWRSPHAPRSGARSTRGTPAAVSYSGNVFAGRPAAPRRRSPTSWRAGAPTRSSCPPQARRARRRGAARGARARTLMQDPEMLWSST